MKLSVIIPVYNVELYIRECLDSVANQKNVQKEEYEIIVINDGSPDSSIEIINNFSWGDVNHIIITQNNQGLSSARNKGLQYASGEYVWFIDSDDFIALDAFSKILSKADGCDIINIGYQEYKDARFGNIYIEEESEGSGNDFLIKGISMPAQFHVFKRDFLSAQELSFYEGIYHEDTEFTPRAFFLAERVGVLPDILYYYRIREGSIMTTINPKRAFDNLIVAKSLIDFSNKYVCKIKESPLLAIICLVINNSLNVISKSNKEEELKWISVFLADKSYVQALCASSIKKYKFEGLLFKITPFNPVSIYRRLVSLKNSR